MKSRLNFVKAMSLFLILILVLANISLTVNASPNAVQPANNIVTIRIENGNHYLIYPDLTVSKTNKNPIPSGYYLVVTDISVILKTKNVMDAHNEDFSIQLLKPDNSYQRIFEKMISLQKIGNGRCIGEVEEHYTTGFAIPSSCNIGFFERILGSKRYKYQYTCC